MYVYMYERKGERERDRERDRHRQEMQRYLYLADSICRVKFKLPSSFMICQFLHWRDSPDEGTGFKI